MALGDRSLLRWRHLREMKDIADYSFRFPEDFQFGTAQSAFQAEGAVDRDGKSENMMEYYQRKFAGQYLLDCPCKNGQ